MQQSQTVSKSTCPLFKLNNGHEVPVVSFGTGGIKDCKDIVKTAILEYGYRHIDTANVYGNEASIGEAL